VRFTARGSLVWLGMILAGFALGGYVLASWPDTSSRIVRLPYGESMPKTPHPQQVRTTAAVEAYPELELAGVAGTIYPGDLFGYELGPTPLLDAVIAAPAAVDAR
jgi:hypothetical protein